MLIAYRPLTLTWVIPTGALVGLLDGLGQLVLGRIAPLLGTLASWLWVISQIPSDLQRATPLGWDSIGWR